MFQDGSDGTTLGSDRESRRDPDVRPSLDVLAYDPSNDGHDESTPDPERLTKRWLAGSGMEFPACSREGRGASAGTNARGLAPTVGNGFLGEQGGRPTVQRKRRYTPARTVRPDSAREPPTGRGRLTWRNCTDETAAEHGSDVALSGVAVPVQSTRAAESAPRPLEVPPAYPPDGFTDSLTLSSKCFSTFPHGTCSLSVSP